MSASINSRTFTRYGGIDVGGTKVEATLFDEHLSVVDRRRVATPTESYQTLLATLATEARWLRDTSGYENLPIGIGIPGLFDPASGKSTTSNLPATGQLLRDDLQALLGGNFAMDNDCKCFALSEANHGAGAGYSRVFGLIIGTGLGGGLCVEGKLISGAQGLIGEVGHIALPAQLVIDKQLPLEPCGCGRTGCYETLASGRGLSRLYNRLIKKSLSPADIVSGAKSGDSDCTEVYNTWIELVGELLNIIQLCMDPHCIVLGGGLSKIPDLAQVLSASLANAALPGARQPAINVARFGDSSGGRGAALLAIQQHQVTYSNE